MSNYTKPPPMWKNPCGERILNKPVKVKDDEKREERLAYKKVESEALIALNRINALRDTWIRSTFNQYFYERLSDFWSVYIPSSFLPPFEETQKQVDGPMPQFYYSDHELVIANLLEWLQRVALGMEVLVRGLIIDQDGFTNQFMECSRRLKSVLCELETLMEELNIPKRPAIERNLMSAEDREPPSKEARNIRDFTIFREYINIMQYTVQAMNRLERLSEIDLIDF